MSKYAWSFRTCEGRWAGFGPYYAMFPVSFAKEVIREMCPEHGKILDPFCGRGTVPFVAQIAGKKATGIDINPVAWVFSTAKTTPEPYKNNLLNRLRNIQHSVTDTDRKAEHEFQKWAWAPNVLGFLNAARRILDWENNQIDRTLMGIIMVHVHAKLGDGLSNQMHKARALGPNYSVNWWKSRDMDPPNVNPVDYLEKRIEWRYQHGVIKNRRYSTIILDSAQNGLSRRKREKFDLLFTSPPYYNVTDYRQDSWIRLWLLGRGPSLPDWRCDLKIANKQKYIEMIESVFMKAHPLLKPHAVIWIRSDARKFTKEQTMFALQKQWPNRNLYIRESMPNGPTQTAHFGNTSRKPGEIDFVIPGHKKLPNDFKLCA